MSLAHKPWNDERKSANGKPIAENFSTWFGDSKVVDSEGNPLVVFHGSTRGGISYATTQTSYFSSSHAVAKTYSIDDVSSAKGESPVVQEMYLKICNPLVVDAQGEPWMRIPFEGKSITTDTLASLARNRGFDGLIIRNVEDNVADEALEPSDVYITLGKKAQIKSANQNSGLYLASGDTISDHDEVQALLRARRALKFVDEVSHAAKEIRPTALA